MSYLRAGYRRFAICLIVSACLSIILFSVHNTSKRPPVERQQYIGADLSGPVPALEVGTKLGKGQKAPQKYFHESTFDAHYDARFGVRPWSHEARRMHLRALIQAYLSAMNNASMETWLMHGSLLGWH